MANASRGTPAKVRGENAATLHGRATRRRVQAIIGQILDEIEQRRAAGRSDSVSRACAEIEKMPALDALRALRDLLPADEPAAGKAPTLNIPALFVQVARAAGEQHNRAIASLDPPGVIDLTANAESPLDTEPA